MIPAGIWCAAPTRTNRFAETMWKIQVRRKVIVYTVRYNCYKANECPKSYRKSVLHLLKYEFGAYLSRYSTDLRYILGHSVLYVYHVLYADVQHQRVQTGLPRLCGRFRLEERLLCTLCCIIVIMLLHMNHVLYLH